MSEFKPLQKKKKKREELSLKQKTYVGIAIFILLTILTVKVFIPMYSRMEGKRMADEINKVITNDHFELMAAERQGIQFFSSFQSTKYKDLYLSTDIAPRDLTPSRINYIYERALEEKPGTMMRFTMATDDILYDELKPVMGDQLLRVIGRFAPGSAELLELDEPFVLGKLKTYEPTVDIQAEPSDERFLQYFEQIVQKLEAKDYGHRGVNIQFTQDRLTATNYQWVQPEVADDPLAQAKDALERLRRGQAVDELTITEEVYYDYPYNHNFTLQEPK